MQISVLKESKKIDNKKKDAAMITVSTTPSFTDQFFLHDTLSAFSSIRSSKSWIVQIIKKEDNVAAKPDNNILAIKASICS
jgi:hypothetical protein